MTATDPKQQEQRRLLLDIVLSEGAAILKRLAPVDEALLDGIEALPVLDHLLDVQDSVGRFDLESDVVPAEGPDENLHRHGVLVRQEEMSGMSVNVRCPIPVELGR